ncbi:unnamed protein product [Plutella xylostella]|uniref:(diamondback moth) hypothetical protein n=1 Tax=Plutella xylostella TaxID=51655 RepID=A0A8S4GAX6_PLUXY|nr:unnamed protein product [Plutella xylostella]
MDRSASESEINLTSQPEKTPPNYGASRFKRQTNLNIENSISFLTSQNEEFKNKIELLEGQAKEDRRYISVLESKIEDLQRENRKTNFEIKNVPKQERETKEDLIEMVLCLSKNIDCSINKTDIKDIYRVRGKRENASNTPIIVETGSTLLKTDVIKMCKNFNIKHKSKLCAQHLGLRSAEIVLYLCQIT